MVSSRGLHGWSWSVKALLQVTGCSLFIGNKALRKVHMLACRKKHTYGPAYISHSDNTNLPWLQLVMSPTQGEVSHQMTAPTKQNNPKIEPTNNMSDQAWITGCLIYCTTSFAVSNSSQEQNLAFFQEHI